MFGRLGERVFRRPNVEVEEAVDKKSVLHEYVLEAIDTMGKGDVYQLRDKIDQLHPVTRKHWWDSRINATPKEVWQTLFMMQFEESTVGCDPVPIIDPCTEKETGRVRFVWSRKTEETKPSMV